MAIKSQTNVPGVPLRWSVSSAAREFKSSEETIRKRLTTEEEAGADGCYSTAQVARALHGGMHAERLREIRGRADLLELKAAALKAEVLDRQLLETAIGAVFKSMGSILASAPIPRSTRDDLLSSLSSIPLAIKGVAEKQTKQLHVAAAETESENGDKAGTSSRGGKGGRARSSNTAGFK
jgi:hypothetical protein